MIVMVYISFSCVDEPSSVLLFNVMTRKNCHRNHRINIRLYSGDASPVCLVRSIRTYVESVSLKYDNLFLKMLLDPNNQPWNYSSSDYHDKRETSYCLLILLLAVLSKVPIFMHTDPKDHFQDTFSLSLDKSRNIHLLLNVERIKV
ncbi:hypothetical protein A0J61_04268 [Choanephora cucurbitarum]|uniref:Uncharacterized protein n=1 Tax=Choanephora cucurbitarum TaxID=101091 RepID=A0A1C7NEZ7_9FUNG|nr:hypothetical protein A0J61_04268 [Choanephora cucurbitarum]